MFGLIATSYSRGMTSSGKRKFTGVDVGVADDVTVFDVVHGRQVPDDGHAVPVNHTVTMVTICNEIYVHIHMIIVGNNTVSST